ncbi:MAG TPA: non-homologous end-joining DNA ligase, partial [Acidimicrobiia bacterium]|nr:non-homologous end-joining DNA ligase [Acidimicrobiia bacterium]
MRTGTARFRFGGGEWHNRLLVAITHPEKLLFPADGITKGQVADYYAAAAGQILPHLIDRPLTLQRFPQGIDREGFMQKNAGKGFPPFIERVKLPKQGGTVEYPAIADEEGLLYLVNQNTITFHIPCFRASDLAHPDRMVFDLDPSQDDFPGARFGARAVADLLTELGVDSQVMTSGSKGYHVVVPLRPTIDFDQLGRFALAVALLLSLRHPKRLTIEFLKKERKGRVFIDWLRNGFGATGVSPFSLRPQPGAPIAMPIAWGELARTDPDRHRL